MNFKNIFSLAVLAALSANVSAIQLYKGKIVSQKVWTNDGSKPLIAMNNKNVMMPLMQHHSDANRYTAIMVESMNAKVDEYVSPQNNHFTGLSNAGNTSQLFNITHTICSNTPEGSEHCVFYNKVVELEVGGYITDDTRPVLNIKFSRPGRYYVNANTTIYRVLDGNNNLIPTTSDAASVIEVA